MKGSLAFIIHHNMLQSVLVFAYRVLLSLPPFASNRFSLRDCEWASQNHSEPQAIQLSTRKQVQHSPTCKPLQLIELIVPLYFCFSTDSCCLYRFPVLFVPGLHQQAPSAWRSRGQRWSVCGSRRHPPACKARGDRSGEINSSGRSQNICGSEDQWNWRGAKDHGVDDNQRGTTTEKTTGQSNSNQQMIADKLMKIFCWYSCALPHVLLCRWWT